MIASQSIDVMSEAMRQLTIWLKNTTENHGSSTAFLLALIVDGLDTHFRLFQCYLQQCLPYLSQTFQSTTSPSTTLILHTVEFLRLVSLQIITADTEAQVRTIVECLMGDSDPIVECKFLFALSKSPNNTYGVFPKSMYSYSPPYMVPRSFSHVCDTNWCRNNKKLVQSECANQIWSVIKRVQDDVQFLCKEHTNNALSLEQLQAINDLPWNCLK